MIIKDYLHIKNARLHNLREIDVKIPLNSITLVSGVSGSGKSSFALDLLGGFLKSYYLQVIEVASSFENEIDFRDFFEVVDSIYPVIPPVIFESARTYPHHLSTVSTVTGLRTRLKALLKLIGTTVCPYCKKALDKKSLDQIVEDLFSSFLNEKALLMAQISLKKQGQEEREKQIKRIIRDGFLRFMADGTELFVDNPQALQALMEANDIAIVTDRLVIRPGQRNRLYDSLRLSEEIGDGIIKIAIKKKSGTEELQFLTAPYCITCNKKIKIHGVKSLAIAGKGLLEIESLSVKEANSFFKKVLKDLQKKGRAFFLIKDLVEFLGLLERLELSHLCLEATVSKISSNEFMKLRLATVVSKALYGALYIFDEPFGSLPKEERGEIIKIINELRSKGNTIIIIENCFEALEASNYIIEFGPGPGTKGGAVIFQGDLDETVSQKLKKEFSSIEFTLPRRKSKKNYISIDTAKGPIRILKNTLNLISGPTGSGKSLLLEEILNSLNKLLDGSFIYLVDQMPIFKQRYSLCATVLGVFGHIRRLFSRTREARAFGLTPSMFSLAKKGGRCEACKGTGEFEALKGGLGRLLSRPCPICQGTGFGSEVLTIKYRGLNIAQILGLTITEAADFFSNLKIIREPLTLAERIGLGYILLGQRVSSLSAGEGQRLKLSSKLSKAKAKKGFFLLDQPTKGLHPKDVERLLRLFSEMLDHGHTLIVADNNEFILKNCQNQIELSRLVPG